MQMHDVYNVAFRGLQLPIGYSEDTSLVSTITNRENTLLWCVACVCYVLVTQMNAGYPVCSVTEGTFCFIFNLAFTRVN